MKGIRSIFRPKRADEVATITDEVVEQAKKYAALGVKAGIVHPDGIERRTKIEGMIRAVWDAPAEYNRETRRRIGMLSKFWRWDVAAFENPQQAPRYLRRHFTTAPPKTRRQRRHRARSLAIAREKGLI